MTKSAGQEGRGGQHEHAMRSEWWQACSTIRACGVCTCRHEFKPARMQLPRLEPTRSSQTHVGWSCSPPTCCADARSVADDLVGAASEASASQWLLAEVVLAVGLGVGAGAKQGNALGVGGIQELGAALAALAVAAACEVCKARARW